VLTLLQCDGEFPCKKCKDDGLICTAGTRKKTEYKQLPPGYAEVLENSQLVLVHTVQKLYSMLRNNEPWDLGEPELNSSGEPIVHNVAAKLGCLRPNNDLDLPVNAVFPEDEAQMAELARQLRDHAANTAALQNGNNKNNNNNNIITTPPDLIKQEVEFQIAAAVYDRTVRAPSSEADHSDLDHDYRRAAFGGGAASVSTLSSLSLSPASLTYPDFDVPPHSAVTAASDGFPPAVLHSSPALMSAPGPMDAVSAAASDYQWMSNNSRPASSAMELEAMEMNPAMQIFFATSPQQQQQQQGGYYGGGGGGDGEAVLRSAVAAAAASYGIKQQPHPQAQQQQQQQAFAQSCRDPRVMVNMGNDPMMYSGYDEDQLRSVFGGSS